MNTASMIYIAGKISGLPIDEAEAKFEAVEKELRSLGLRVINPMDMGIKHWKYDDQIAECKRVIRVHATAIYLLRDWKQSKGAKIKFQEVVDINSHRASKIHIYYEESAGMNDIVRDISDGVLTCLVQQTTN